MEPTLRTKKRPSGAHRWRLKSLWSLTRNVLFFAPVGAALYLGLSRPGFRTNQYRAVMVGRDAGKLLREHWDSVAALGARLDAAAEPRPSVVLFSDYECPACRGGEPRLQAFLESNPSVGVVFRHFPLAQHPMAEEAARASICAQKQGRFIEMNGVLLADSAWMNGTDWKAEVAAAAIPNVASFAECLSSPETMVRLAADQRIGKRLGIKATPALATREGVTLGIPTNEFLARLARLKPTP